MSRPEKCPFCSAAVEAEGPVCRQCGFDLDSDWQPDPQDGEAVFDPGQRACHACGELNPLGVDFCSKCNAPVGDQTMLKPFESVQAATLLSLQKYKDSPRSSLLRKLAGAALIGGAGAFAWMAWTLWEAAGDLNFLIFAPFFLACLAGGILLLGAPWGRRSGGPGGPEGKGGGPGAGGP